MVNENQYFDEIFSKEKESFSNSPLIIYTIIDKVSNKRALFNPAFNYGTFFNTVLLDLFDALHKFIEFLNLKTNHSNLYSSNNKLDKSITDLSNEQLCLFRNHLSVQHYKLIEVALPGNTLIEKEALLRRFYSFYKDEVTCRILTEAIQEIEIVTEQNLKTTYTFFYEIENLIVRGRDYIDSELRMDYSEELKIKPYFGN